MKGRWGQSEEAWREAGIAHGSQPPNHTYSDDDVCAEAAALWAVIDDETGGGGSVAQHADGADPPGTSSTQKPAAVRDLALALLDTYLEVGVLGCFIQ